MAKKKKSKYTIREDGRVQTVRTINGKKKYFYADDDRELEDKIDAYMKSLEGELIVKASFVADKWWEETFEEISPNTVGGYRTAYKRFKAEFGEMDIAAITMQDCIKYIQAFAIKGYAQKTINNHKTVMLQIFSYAQIHNYIQQSPAYGMPDIKGKKKVMRQPAAQSDIDTVEKIKMVMPYGTMFYFLLYSGLRRNEAVGLQAKDIDYTNKLIYVRRNIAYGEHNKPIIKEPKTVNGIRTVPLLDNVAEILPQYDDPETYIFFPLGLPTRKLLEKGLSNFYKENNISSTAHQFRHSFASILHDADIDAKDAQHILGHAQISTTMDIYTHLDVKRKAVVGNKLNNYVNPKEDEEST